MEDNNNIVEVKPFADIYTVMMIVATLAFLVTIILGGMRLMSKPVAGKTGFAAGGYGMTVGQLFEPFKVQDTAPPAPVRKAPTRKTQDGV